MGKTVVLISAIIILTLVILVHTSAGQYVQSGGSLSTNSLTSQLLDVLLRATGLGSISQLGQTNYNSNNNNPIYDPNPPSYNSNPNNQQSERLTSHPWASPGNSNGALSNGVGYNQQNQQRYDHQHQHQSLRNEYQQGQSRFIQQQLRQRRPLSGGRQRRRQCTRQMVEEHCHCLPECPPLYEERRTCGGAAVIMIDAMAQCCPFWMSAFNCW